ncbi:hypothetical protein A3C37_04275 [Candidatus Peribacteria bacterium RIFCSPHIGHO2_02_FULL_53_20]|nr:MAG: hypothetical protein A3C37_04275 [Candidatus Peribacteria bacterium RIFCSPHIGHO2_02_FULL_53_20]OGJ70301.1 MAG: hypothetical protein A3G69_04860 [Candidatus Peribacteria bacterium RIFCSPLOWO2_12_FULL_53_10]
MKILFTRFPLESRFGGAEVQTLALMKGLKERGHEVAFMGSCSTLLKKVAGCKLQIFELDIGIPPVSKVAAFTFLWRKLSMGKKIRSAICNLQLSSRPDVVCMLSLSEKLLLTKHLTEEGIRVIWIEHDRIGRWLTRNPWLPKLRKLSELATTVVVSDLSKKIYEKLEFQNVIAIPNGIDTSRLSPPPLAPPPRGEGKLRIGTIARLSNDKGIDVLIDAIRDLPDISLTIVGTGPERVKLEAQLCSGRSRSSATELGPSNQQSTIILPLVDDLASFYRSLDLFVLPSREHDPFGLVAGEAMMMGIPTIVTDACGIAGYLQNGRDAVIVPAGSAKDLRNAILDLKNNPEKRALMGAIGKGTAEESFSMERMVRSYEIVLKENKTVE